MGEIIAFFGADTKVGVTMLSQVISQELAGCNKSNKVLLLHFDGKSGFDYTTMKGHGSIDTLRAAIAANVLTKEELDITCAKQENLYMLQGTTNILERHVIYNTELVKSFFEMVREMYDYIIVDAGCNIDSPLTMGSILYSDKNVLITTQQKTSLNNYISIEQNILYPAGISFEDLIVNKFAYSTGKFLETEETLKTRYGTKNAFGVPLLTYNWQAEYEQTTLLAYKNKAYSQAIASIVKLIIAPKQEKTKSKLFRR